MMRQDTRNGANATNAKDSISPSAVNTIRRHARVIPSAPAGEFHCSGRLAGDERDGLSFHDIDTSTVIQLSHVGIFEQRGSVKRLDKSGSRVKTWAVAAEYRERAQAVLDGWNSPIGCGHTGVRNIRGGGFTCCNDDCDVEVRRGEVDL